MLKIYNIKDKLEYLEEVEILTYLEWGNKINNEYELLNKINTKIKKVYDKLNNPYFCKLILLDNEELIGFISLFENDCDEKKELKPWYSTMYVKKEYRGKGYSKILNDAILKEARVRGFKKLYLKTDLINYYEKFGACYLEKLNNGEKLYYIEL